MFKVYEIKNSNRRGEGTKKTEPIPESGLIATRPNERSVPYYSVVPEQVSKHTKYWEMAWEHRGVFRLLCDDLWRGGGKVPNLDTLIAKNAKIPLEVWNNAKPFILKAGLLSEITDGAELMQPEMREQYLQFLEGHSKTT